jgi:hypothetical protein
MIDVNSVANFVAWIDATLEKLNSADADAVTWDYWPQAWDDAVAYADALGLSDEVESLGGPIRCPIYVGEKNGEYDYDTPRKAIRDKLRKRLVALRLKLTGNASGSTPPFVPNGLQRDILTALRGRALNKQRLADEVCGGEGSRLYKSSREGDLNELMDLGRVANKARLGYYRPDSPPRDVE